MVLAARRWPQRFRCPNCSHAKACWLRQGTIRQYHRCHGRTSLTAGTLFANTKLPLRIGFLAIYLLTQSKVGLSALSLKRPLGASYNTAWLLKHKWMRVMKERDDTRPLRCFVQLDDAYWGGERHGQDTGRGTAGKTPFVAAVQCSEDGRPIALRMSVVKSFRSGEIQRWASGHLAAGSHVVSDGLLCFRAVTAAGCTHSAEATGSGLQARDDTRLNWVNTVLGSVKNALHGSCHAMNPKHLPHSLAEFSDRFNRRFDLAELVPRLACVALRTPPLPYRLATLAESCG